MCSPGRVCGAALGVVVAHNHGVNLESAFNISDSAKVQAVGQCSRRSLTDSFSRENKNELTAISRRIGKKSGRGRSRLNRVGHPRVMAG
jgi:hypothetical protein